MLKPRVVVAVVVVVVVDARIFSNVKALVNTFWIGTASISEDQSTKSITRQSIFVVRQIRIYNISRRSRALVSTSVGRPGGCLQ